MNYLQEYVNALRMVILLGQKTIIVNPESYFVYVSPLLMEKNNVLGIDLSTATYDSLPAIQQISASCILEDAECLKTRQIQQYITSQNYDGEIQLYLKQKTPLVDPNIDQAVGVRVDFFPIFSLGHFKPYINNHIVKYDNLGFTDRTRLKLELTEIEELIVFLLIMHAKPKVVTHHLNLIMHKDTAVSTVRNIIHQQLLRKFEVLTVEDLIDKAIFLGYDTMLPRIMVEQFSIRIV